MPTFQRLAEEINLQGRFDRMREADPDAMGRMFDQDRDLVDILKDIVPDLSKAEVRFIESWPEALGEGARAAIRSAATRKQRIQAQWTPGYDFELRIWEPRSEGGSPGGLVLHFVTPYPSDVGAKRRATATTRSVRKAVSRKSSTRKRKT